MNEKLSYDDVNILPKYSEISSRDNVDISTEICGHELNIPVIAAPMESVMGIHMWRVLTNNGATGAFHRFGDMSLPGPVYSDKLIIPSIGVDLEPPEFYDYINTVLIDVAHGHHKKVKLTIKYLKENSDLNVIAGNVATPDAAVDLVKWGADALRIGIGGGSVCTTRMKTGVGVPMISCIHNIYSALHRPYKGPSQPFSPKYKSGYKCNIPKENPDGSTVVEPVPIIADGGIKSAGDICKALAAGADAVMCGSLFAGTDEAPGEIIEVDGKKMKKYYGSASFEQKGEQNYVEGVSSLVPHKGSVVDILKDIKDGIRSSFSYVGASNLEEFHENAELIRVSQNGHKKGKAHI